MKTIISIILCASAALAASNPKLGPKIRLFNGKNLDGFYTYLEKQGKNNDPDHVFRMEHGAVHVSGVEFGYFCTEKEYENYYLHVVFKWGEQTHAPRDGKARDSGVLYHVNGVLANEGNAASLTKGRILFQSEGAEVFFKTMELRQVLHPAAGASAGGSLHFKHADR